MTVQEFAEGLCSYRRKHHKERRGQSLFNFLYEICPDFANEIRGGDHDPFYMDGGIMFEAARDYILRAICKD